MAKGKILVSACLIGINCRYDGKRIKKIKAQDNFIPYCPEQAGGLTTPRPRSIVTTSQGIDVLRKKARVRTENGRDVTENFLKGAYEAGRLLRIFKIKKAFLKARSPSCGEDGVLTAYLRKKGITLKFF